MAAMARRKIFSSCRKHSTRSVSSSDLATCLRLCLGWPLVRAGLTRCYNLYIRRVRPLPVRSCPRPRVGISPPLPRPATSEHPDGTAAPGNTSTLGGPVVCTIRARNPATAKCVTLRMLHSRRVNKTSLSTVRVVYMGCRIWVLLVLPRTILVQLRDPAVSGESPNDTAVSHGLIGSAVATHTFPVADNC